MRQTHRWLSALFTPAVIGNIVLDVTPLAQEQITLWAGFLTHNSNEPAWSSDAVRFATTPTDLLASCRLDCGGALSAAYCTTWAVCAGWTILTTNDPIVYRVFNVENSAEPLLYMGVYPARAGHNYGAFAARNFLGMIVERGGRPTLLERSGYSADHGETAPCPTL